MAKGGSLQILRWEGKMFIFKSELAPAREKRGERLGKTGPSEWVLGRLCSLLDGAALSHFHHALLRVRALALPHRWHGVRWVTVRVAMRRQRWWESAAHLAFSSAGACRSSQGAVP